MDAGVAFDDARAQSLLGEIMREVPAPAGSPLAALFAILQDLGVVIADPDGGLAVSQDAFAALGTDAGAFLAPRIAASLPDLAGKLGFGPVGDGPWSLALPGGPALEVYLARTGGSCTLGLRAAGGTPLSLGTNASLAFDASLALPAFQPSLTATLRIGAFNVAWAGGACTVSAPPWLVPVPVTSPPQLAPALSALKDALPNLILSGVASAALETVLGPGWTVGPLDAFFRAPGPALANALADGAGIGPQKLAALLQTINQALGLPDAGGLSLPGGLLLQAGGGGADPVTLTLSTVAPLGGLVAIQAGLSCDRQLHVAPQGTATLSVTGLPAGNPLGWTALAVTFGASSSGLTLAVTPAGGAPIQILPTFSGLGALAQNLEALLPRALDELVQGIGGGSPAPGSMLAGALDVAAALGLYDTTGGFANHAAQLTALLQDNWTAALSLPSTLQSAAAQQAAAAQAIAQLFPGLTGLAAAGGAVSWSTPVGAGGMITVGLGWDSSGPILRLAVSGLKQADGALLLDLEGGWVNGAVLCSAGLGIDLAAVLGIPLQPGLSVSSGAGAFSVDLLPLGPATNGPSLTVELAPAPGLAAPAGLAPLLEQLLLPLAASLLLKAVPDQLALPVWPGAASTLADVLLNAGLIGHDGQNGYKLTLGSDWGSMALEAAGALAVAAGSISIPDTPLSLAAVGGASGLGVTLTGSTPEWDLGACSLAVLFGPPPSWGTNTGVTFRLLGPPGAGQALNFAPRLELNGLGVSLAGPDDGPLIDNEDIRLQGVKAVLFLTCDFQAGLSFENFGAGAELLQFGLPLGKVTGDNVGGDNPVASSLLQPDSGGGAGDAPPVNPGVDVSVWYAPPANSNTAAFNIQIGDSADQALWIPVQAGFGPIFINQLGLAFDSVKPSAAILIDGSVKVGGLTAEADELGVTIPLHSLGRPGDWTLDLKGLAVSYQSPGVTVAGGLVKNTSGSVVEYDGMLLVSADDFGFVAVGAYSTPTDEQGQYTSLFVFLGAFVVITIPPAVVITGLGLGLGYNRELIVPDDVAQVPGFILVAALDGGGALANDPMAELKSIRDSMPSKRGSFWLAAGVRGNAFVIVQLTAIVYVALDRGVEVGVLGIARLALPGDDTALVNVELALKARFSSAEGVLSVQAQLTSNSYLLSPDCQLTGGFAFFLWFQQSQFLITLGGYHPSFQKPPQFPDVPRLGYRWSVSPAIVLKGECYFALTNSCVMAGARFECTYGPDWIQVWFLAYGDLLMAWHPFFYEADIGVSIGARFSIDIDIPFDGSISIDLSVSVGAVLTVAGPPLHGEVSVDFDVGSVTISFGPTADPRPPPITAWTGDGSFTQKFIYNGQTGGAAVAIHPLTGLLPPQPPGAQPSPGTPDQPWRLGAEFSFRTETRMAAATWRNFAQADSGAVPGVRPISLNPMAIKTVALSRHGASLAFWNETASQWQDIAQADGYQAGQFTLDPIIGQVPEAVWGYYDPTAPPAAARTLPVIVGLQITAVASPQNQSALIPISRLVDAGDSRPLPFAAAAGFSVLRTYGLAAIHLEQLAAGASGPILLAAARRILGGGDLFAQGRSAAGLPAAGLDPFALRSLEYDRSSPPRLAPLSTGLTMKPVGLAPPPRISVVAVSGIVTLEAPRLRALLRGHPRPAADAPAAIRTSAARAAAAAVPRMAPPTPVPLAGARLRRVAGPLAARSARLAANGRTLRSPELGWSLPGAKAEAFRQAEAAVVSAGVELAAGVTHVWDLPAAPAFSLALAGAAAVRVVCLDLAGAALLDREFPGAASAPIPIPAGTGLLAVTCLGQPSFGNSPPAPGFGAVSLAASPAGRTCGVGWQLGTLAAQVAPRTALARGASVVLPAPAAARRNRQLTSQALVRIGDLLADQPGVETRLPAGVDVVMLMLDQAGGAGPGSEDLALAASGAKLAPAPLVVAGGVRTTLLYDVVSRDAGADSFSLAVASRSRWRVAGVVGLTGRAREWAARFNGRPPETLVPDDILTPQGSATIRLIGSPAIPS